MIKLPKDFADLEALAGKWARGTEHERNEIRWTASVQDFAEFYEQVLPKLDSILGELAKHALDEMDGQTENLFNLATAFAEAAPHHELYDGSPVVPHSFSARRFVPGHGDLASSEVHLR
ncbi:hypothetical protein [Hyphococcus lacteus]|uniref:Uncharacterized protein n=1 Tax=Hyphococcus lacteus TaxID=3143536 RepID=A0ABV3Z169_9PROT